MKHMRGKPWFLALGLLVMATAMVEAEDVIKGTMAVTGAEMK
jgi:hypothetical protein